MSEIGAIVQPPHKVAQAERDALLDALTGTPPDAGERFSHTDLRHLSAAALWDELVLVHLRLSIDACPHLWWRERYRRIREELLRTRAVSA